MKKEPAILLYFRDFLVSTDLMTNEQVGAHIRILCHQADKGHLHEESIRERFGSIWDSIKHRYKKDDNGLWYHPRMEKTIKDRKGFVAGRLRNLEKNTESKPHEAPISGPHVGGSPFPFPSSSSTPKSNSIKNTFDMFWNLYPKKVGKDAALRAWNKIKEPAKIFELIKDALSWQKESYQWQKDGGQYIPNPATYLNQGRWKDDKNSYPKKSQEDGGWKS